MSLLNLFRKKDRIQEAVNTALKSFKPSRVDSDFARTKEIIQMVNSLQQNRPENNMQDFFKQMMGFEQMKTAIVETENNKLDRLAEQIEAESDGNDDSVNLDTIMSLIGRVKNQNTSQNTQQNRFPEVARPSQASEYANQEQEIKSDVQLSEIEQKAVDMAVKKIPKIAKKSFEAMTDAKKDAVINAILKKL